MARKAKQKGSTTTKANGGSKARRATTVAPNTSTAPPRRAPRRVDALQKFLQAYGTGSEANALRQKFAKRTGTTLPYLVHIGYGFRLASPKLAMDIEKHTHGLVGLEDLRPDIDWSYLVQRRIAAPINMATR